MPTWVAPEVLMEQQYNEKSDCYSLGIIMWELLTCQHPYAEYQNKNNHIHIIEDVIKSAKRPKIPDRFSCEFAPKIAQEYVFLMEQLWDQSPALRPSFYFVVNRCNEILSSLC